MKEQDIRPNELFERYLALARRDADALLARRGEFEAVACPGCGERRPQPGLLKDGWSYSLCGGCGSLYLDPRPSAALLGEFYGTAESVRFWSSDFYRQTEEARRERLFKPRAQHVAQLAWSLKLGADAALCDVGSGYGIFLEEVRASARFHRVFGVEPAAELAEVCRKKGFQVFQRPVEALRPGDAAADLVCAFEVLEHVHDPATFLVACRRLLMPKGRVLATTLVCTGFDIALLWERSRSVHPPHHINLMSIRGIEKLFHRAGFELETPGKLDVDIVRNALAADPALPLPRFARTLAESDDKTRAELQEFLAGHRLSSHVRVLARAA